MKPERTELSTGIFFSRMPVDKFKMSLLSVYLTLPLGDESAASKIALLQYVLRQGTKSYPTAPEISRRLEALYSADLASGIFKSGENQVLLFSIGVLQSKFVPDGTDLLTPAAELLKEIVFDPILDKTTGVFRDEYVEREKKNACDRIRSIQNNKALYAKTRCLSAMCSEEAYGISEIGTVEEIEKITPASLYTAYRSLLSEARIDIFYSGTEDSERVMSAFLPSLGAIRRYPRTPAVAEIRRTVKRRKTITERTTAEQGKLCIGFRAGTSLAERDAAAVTLFHSVFGGSPTSKLFANVRERLSLCYSCSSQLQLTKGIFLVSAGIENKKKRRALREIFHQLARMRAGKISEKEHKMALKTLINQCRSLSDEPASMERWYFTRALIAGTDQSPEEFAAELERVTVKDLARVAKNAVPDTVFFLRGIHEGEEEGEEDDA